RGGQIRLFGQPIARLSPEAIAQKGVGLGPRGRRIFPKLTVKENLDVAFQKRDSVWNRERVFDLFPRLRERKEQYAGSLSGGEQQMLPLRRAPMGESQGLIVQQ